MGKSVFRYAVLIFDCWLANYILIRGVSCHNHDVSHNHQNTHSPPSFIHEPNDDEIFFVVEPSSEIPSISISSVSREYRFRCKATGCPSVKYSWKKNKQDLNLLNDDRVTVIPGEGSIIIRNLKHEDEGVYECWASNENGTAVDKPINFKRAFIHLMPYAPVETISIDYGAPFERECIAPLSVPKARVFWVLSSSSLDGVRRFLSINKTNVAENSEGKIFFQYVREGETMLDGLYYTCIAENFQLKDYKFGPQFKFNVIRNSSSSSEQYLIARKQFYSPDKITVLRGQNLELYCIVSGYPDRKPKWEKDGTPLMIDFSQRTIPGKSMTIENVTFQDEGKYSCKFSEKEGHLNKTFSVSIESAPFWTDSPPKNLNSSEGSNVEFLCNVQGKPQPQFTFYKNGLPLSHDARYEITYSRLVIKSAKRTDIAVYQCKASNLHGSVWTNFYLNFPNNSA